MGRNQASMLSKRLKKRSNQYCQMLQRSRGHRDQKIYPLDLAAERLWYFSGTVIRARLKQTKVWIVGRRVQGGQKAHICAGHIPPHFNFSSCSLDSFRVVTGSH